MEYLNFCYTIITTGHSLNMVAAEPGFSKAVRAHCKKHNCHPIVIYEAVYDFIREKGMGKTFHRIQVEMEDGKGAVVKWLKENRLQWVFGVPNDDAREV